MAHSDDQEKCGDINFNIEYDYQQQTLKLRIIQVTDFNKDALLQ